MNPRIQEIFTQGVEGICKQGKPGMQMGFCMYRTPDGLKCLIGQCIPDEAYHPNMEGKGAANIRITTAVGVNFGDAHILLEMQRIHDSVGFTSDADFMEKFKSNAIRFANTFNLELPECLK
jgi:hypothetical protein